MLTKEQIIKLRTDAGLSPTVPVAGQEDIIAKRRTALGLNDTVPVSTPTFSPIKAATGFVTETAKNAVESVKNAGEGIATDIKKGQAGEINPLSAGLQAAGHLAGGTVGAIASPLTALAGGATKEIISKLPPETQIAIADALHKVANSDEIKLIQETAKQHPELAGNLKALIDIGTLFIGGKAAEEVGTAVKETGATIAETAPKMLETGLKASEKVISKATDLGLEGVAKTIDIIPRATKGLVNKVSPEPTAIEAAGQVLQGQTKNIKQGIKAISDLDISKVSTFADLSKEMESKIGSLAKTVDSELAKDTSSYRLKQLAVKEVSKSGKKITTDYVSNALAHLQELYNSTGDSVAKQDVIDLIKKAQTEGLTRLEVNDISRVYGQEFGQKAFNKLGEPLTSINAQKFENTRKGLKVVARQGIGGKEATAADKAISDLYDTKRLVDKNVEAVNKLKQKIQKQGILAKAGHAITKYADILSGGSIRGIIGGLLPRGVGYKVMNALDLEDVLSKNLNIIQKAVDSSNDEEITKLLDSLIPKP